MPLRYVTCLALAWMIAGSSSAIGANTVDRPGQDAVPQLVATIASRHSVPAGSDWHIAVPERVVETADDNTHVAVTLFAFRNADGTEGLLLVQRNVLPGVSGWGPPSLCNDGQSALRVTVYQSPRDVLCGWAEMVSSNPSASPIHTTAMATALLGPSDRVARPQAGRWLALGWRVSNRNDFLDLQLLLPSQATVMPATTQAFVEDVAHSLDATWQTGAPTAVPMPPPPPKVAEPEGSLWSGTLSASAMKTATYRVGVSIKTFMVASLMAGDAATGGAIIGILNFTSTGIYLANDYLWETWYPLSPSPQNFVQLVERR